MIFGQDDKQICWLSILFLLPGKTSPCRQGNCRDIFIKPNMLIIGMQMMVSFFADFFCDQLAYNLNAIDFCLHECQLKKELWDRQFYLER
jgi:hypothetical protein